MKIRKGIVLWEIMAVFAVFLLMGSYLGSSNYLSAKKTLTDRELITRGSQIETKILSYSRRHANQLPEKLDEPTLRFLGLASSDTKYFTYTVHDGTFNLQTKLSDGTTWTSIYSGKKTSG